MNSFWIALAITALLYAIPASIRTFRNEMTDDRNVWLVVICGWIVTFCLLTG